MRTYSDKDSRCPECGGLLGDTRLEWALPGGRRSEACLSCDYVRQAPATDTRLESRVWCLSIRWGGETATLKEAALLRQFVPLFRETPISEVRQLLGSASEWTVDALSEAAVLQLREAAEARGFTVHVRPGGRDWPRLKLPRPGSGMAGYCVRLSPAFLERSHILATFGPVGGVVSIAHGPSSTETADIPRARGLRFLEEITAFEPLGIPDDSRQGLDGVSLQGLVQEERGNHRFFAWSPEPDTSPRQHGFVLALLRLAMNVARETGTVEYLEHLSGYVGNGLRGG